MTMCEICPFRGSIVVTNEFWQKQGLEIIRVVDKIEDCALILFENGQIDPHQCFLKAGNLSLRPAEEDEIPCVGHLFWLKRRNKK